MIRSTSRNWSSWLATQILKSQFNWN